MYSEALWKENLDIARRLVEISQKALEEGREKTALKGVRKIFFALADGVREDFMKAACPCGHAYSAHRPLYVPEADEPEDSEPTSGLFLACEPCSKQCVEIVPVPTRLD